ncbi:type II secretion system F family protein [Altererythrobacter sp. GH1-8]|uniref:type II secretion system F family protein n=1 Tax=Altererythrobacter sp. GH1-8 TaxID=3349333 RepID=UPI00374C947A
MTLEITRIFIMIAVFAAVFLIAQALVSNYAASRSYRGAVNKRLRMIGSGQNRDVVVGKLIKNRPRQRAELPQGIEALIAQFEKTVFAASIPFSAGQIMVFMALGFAAVFLVGVLFSAASGAGVGFGTILMVFIFAIAVAVFIPILVLGNMARSRRNRMERQFPVALDIFVRALRSGHPIASAIDLLTKEMEDPIGSEFGLISDEVAYGADLIGALEHMADRWDLEDMRMFVVSLSVQSQTGGNLAEILDNIAKVIRDRHQMFMKVRALSSEGRMTGWMLTGLPVVTFVLIFSLAPQYYLEAAEDPIFIYSAVTLIVMYCVGVYVIRRLIDLKV